MSQVESEHTTVACEVEYLARSSLLIAEQIDGADANDDGKRARLIDHLQAIELASLTTTARTPLGAEFQLTVIARLAEDLFALCNAKSAAPIVSHIYGGLAVIRAFIRSKTPR